MYKEVYYENGVKVMVCKPAEAWGYESVGGIVNTVRELAAKLPPTGSNRPMNFQLKTTRAEWRDILNDGYLTRKSNQ